VCELVGMSAQHSANFTFSLKALAEHSDAGGPSDGWGIAYFDKEDARRIRDTSAAWNSPWTEFVAQTGLTSDLIIAHIRNLTVGEVALKNTQPFYRVLGGRAHVFAHNGHFPEVLTSEKFHTHNFQRIGDTDSEQAFCLLLEQLRKMWIKGEKAPSFEQRWQTFQKYCAQLRPLGPANILYSDSEYLFVHGNRRTQSNGQIESPGLHWLCRECNESSGEALVSDALTVHTEAQKVVLVASVPLTKEKWQPLDEGEMLAVHKGQIIAKAQPDNTNHFSPNNSNC